MRFDVERPRRSKKTGRKPSRMPHNATAPGAYQSLNDIIEAVASEQRRMTVRGKEVVVSRRERDFRVMIGKALDGNVRELAQVLRLMIKHPSAPATVTTQIYLGGLV